MIEDPKEKANHGTPHKHENTKFSFEKEEDTWNNSVGPKTMKEFSYSNFVI